MHDGGRLQCSAATLGAGSWRWRAALPSDAASRAEAAGAMRVIGGDASLRLVGDDSSTSSSEEEEEGGGGGRSRRSRTWAPRVSITLEEP